MKNSFSLSKNNKAIVSALCIWTFIHTFILLRYYELSGIWIISMGHNDDYYLSKLSKFFPFTYIKKEVNGMGQIFEYTGNQLFDIRFYDKTEYFVYVIGAWLIYFLYRYLKKE